MEYKQTLTNNMEKINILNDLENWLVDYITDTIQNLEAEKSEEFNRWAKSFERDEAEFVVKMEFVNDWGYDKRTEVSIEEASKYAKSLLEKILNHWYM